MPLNICPICLRTDRKLKAIATVLSVYHDELTDYSLEISNPRYCSECEYLLRKTYNFHKKCSNAAKILKKWQKNKVSPSLLHLKLPPIALDTWTPENNTVFTYTYIEDLDTPTLEDTISDKPDAVALKEVKLSEKIDMDTVKEEVDENTIHSENLFKIEMHCENYEITEVSEILFKNSNTESDDTTNVYQNKLTNDNTTNAGISGRNNIKRNKVKRSKNKINDREKGTNITASSSCKNNVHENNEISFIEQVLDIHDVTNIISNKKYEILKSTNVSKITDDLLKLNEESKSCQMSKFDVPLTDKSISTCDMTNSTHNKLSQNMPKVTDGSNNKTINANKPEEMDVELICFDDDSKNDNIIIIDDEINHQDDESLNSNDDCDDYLYSPRKKRKRKMTLDQLADIELSDEDFDDDYISNKQKETNKSVKKDYSIDKVISTEKSINSKLDAMSESLDSICENWEVTSLLDVDVPNLPNDEVKRFTRQFLAEKKLSEKMDSAKLKYLKKRGVEAKLAHMSAELDSIKYKCDKLVEEYKTGLTDPKERLKAELIQKFDSWGDLRSDDGFVFDKDIIINCLDMVNERLIKQLINFLHGATTLSPGAAIILKRIQNKQHESQYESVFQIEYMTTEREMLEEFERRKTYECYVEARFKCETCYQGFKHERQLDYHKKCHDESNGPIVCSICGVRHRSRRALKKHMSAHLAVYKCRLCPLITYYRLSMINHYEQHKGTLYKCEPCGGTYKSKSAFLSHQTHSHPTGGHVCVLCGRAFISPLGLRNHAHKKHRGEAPAPATGGVRCSLCSLSFPTQEAYSRHERTLHGAPPAYKKKRAPRFLKPRKKPIMTCRVCNTVGHSYGWLTLHFSTEHPALELAAALADTRTHLCHVCGKGFSNKYTLREHIGLHSGEWHPCPVCPKRFLSSAALRRHRLTHAPPGFCCERCGKKFHSYPNLYNHMRTHIGDRRFKCNICSKGFLHRCSLKEHIRGVHNHERRVRKRGVEAGLRDTGTVHGDIGTIHGDIGTIHGDTGTRLLGDETGGRGLTDMGVKGVLETGAGEMTLAE